MSDLEEYWFDPPEGDDPRFPPLPRADRRPLVDPEDWRAAEGHCVGALAEAAGAIGLLDGLIAGLTSVALRRGVATRLALTEVEALLWATGTPLAPDVLIRDLAEAPAGTDLEVLGLARWALRRLEGRGRPDDLRDFLGLHRLGQGERPGRAEMMRPTGADFDAAAAEFQATLAALGSSHLVTRAAFGQRLWRLSDLSPDGHLPEPCCWASRAMASSCRALVMVPMGPAGRRVWTAGGDPAAFLAEWCAAVASGCTAGFEMIRRLSSWAARAERAADRMHGATAARTVAVLTAQPVVSAALLAREAAISRDTAERLLVRLHGLGLVREITGGRRYRFWRAVV